MLDTTASPEAAHRQDTRAVGNAVSCCLPVAEDVGTDKPNVRRCPVLDIESIAGTRF